METPLLQPISYSGKIYRNFFTCSPTQSLYDDVCDEKDYGPVDAIVQLTSGVDHSIRQVERPFQYGKIEDEEIFAVFKKENWRPGRFGDGKDYGVWYGAEEDLTTVYEASWVAFRLGKDNVLKKGEVYITDRKMVEVDVSTSLAIDLTQEQKFLSQLIHPVDWKFCQAWGTRLIHEKIELMRTASARRVKGVCVPLFSPNPIQRYDFLYYLKIQVYPNGFIGVNSSQERMNLSFQASDLEDPHTILKNKDLKS